MLPLLALLAVFSDSAHSKPVFTPVGAFSAPREYGLTRDAIVRIDREMSEAMEARRAIGDDGGCATAAPQPKGDVDASGTVVEITAGWNSEQRTVTSLARVKLAGGEEALVEFPFGEMQLGRTTWCTGMQRLKSGDTVSFNARRVAGDPARLLATSWKL